MKKLTSILILPLLVGVMSVQADTQATPAQVADAQLDQTLRDMAKKAREDGAAAAASAQDPSLPEGFRAVPDYASDSYCKFAGLKREGSLALGYFRLKYEPEKGTMSIIPPNGYPTVTFPIGKNLRVTDTVSPEVSGSPVTAEDIAKAPTSVMALVRVDGSDKTREGVNKAVIVGLAADCARMVASQSELVFKHKNDERFLTSFAWSVRKVIFEDHKVLLASQF